MRVVIPHPAEKLATAGTPTTFPPVVDEIKVLLKRLYKSLPTPDTVHHPQTAFLAPLTMIVASFLVVFIAIPSKEALAAATPMAYLDRISLW